MSKVSNAAIADVFFALGDPTRLSVVRKLVEEGEQSSTMLAEGASVSRQAIVKHLQVLEGAGLISCRKDRREVLYAVESRRLNDARQFLNGISAGWDDAIARLRKLVEQEPNMEGQDIVGKVQKPVKKRLPKSRVAVTTRSKFSWFFALRPLADDAQRVFTLAENLLASKGIMGARITPDRLHITLEWIGDDVEENVITRACQAADTIAFGAVEATFTSAKTFPAPSGPCVLLGKEGLNDVRKLRATLAAAMAAYDFKAPRAYEPHMTLCYDRVHRLPITAIEPVTFRVTEFVLVKSYLGLSRHEVVRTWPLQRNS